MDLLFSLEVHERNCGYSFVRMWAGRGRIPAAVEATGNFVKLKADLDRVLGELGDHSDAEEDYESKTDSTLTQQEDTYVMRLSATMALVRFVNEMVDPGQKGSYAQPITRIAEQIGLPRNLVDLRHSGTHDELPSAGVLQLALQQALDWLFERYWDPARNWEAVVKEKCQMALERLEEELAELQAKPDEPSIDEQQLQQKKLRITAKFLNSIDHLQVSLEIQKIFLAVLSEKYSSIDHAICKLSLDCLSSWLGRPVDFPVDLVPSPLTNSIVANSNSLLDETAEIMKRLAEAKRRKVEAETSSEWRQVVDWKPCDLGTPIDLDWFRRV